MQSNFHQVVRGPNDWGKPKMRVPGPFEAEMWGPKVGRFGLLEPIAMEWGKIVGPLTP